MPVPSFDTCTIRLIGNSELDIREFINALTKRNSVIPVKSDSFHDWYFREGRFEVAVEFIEHSSINMIPEIYDVNQDVPLFILFIEPPFENPEYFYSNPWLKRIKELSPEAIVLIIFIDNDNLITRNLNISKFRKLNPNVREIFSSFELSQNGLEEFSFILRQIIINSVTDSLDYAKRIIKENYLSKNKELDLGNCYLTSLDEVKELFDNTHLEKLILSNEWSEFKNNQWYKVESINKEGRNKLSYIPFEIYKLSNLKKIVFGGDWNDNKTNWNGWRIDNILPLSRLKKLELINLSNNKITRINNLNHFKELTILHLNNNLISRISTLNVDLKLNEIYLSNNLLTTVSFLKELKHVTTIDLHANLIKDLTPLIGIIKKIGISNSKWEKKTLNVAKNYLNTPPIEFVNEGTEAVLNYFIDIAKGKNYINKEVKLILVGNSEVGKTTLAKYLDNEIDLDQKHLPTLWLNERKIESKAILNKTLNKCQINLFDFGGHDFFHDTHHLFFGTNTIYILLWDKETNRLNCRTLIQENLKNEKVQIQTQDYPIKYWLDSIKHFIKEKESDNFAFEIVRHNEYNSSVLVVQNKVEKVEDIVHLNNHQVQNNYPFVYEFININIKPKKRNIGHFDSLILEMLDNTEIIGAKLPGYYGIIKGEIENYNGIPILSITDFNDYCNSLLLHKITIEQTKTLASYLKQIGVVLYFPDAQNGIKVYVDKKWVITQIYSLLNGMLERFGEFDLDYVKTKLALSDLQIKDIIDLMIDFKIIFKHPNSDVYIAPLYLPSTPIQPVSLFIGENKKPYRRFIYNGFIHKSIILNLFQEYGKMALKANPNNTKDLYYYWKDGLIIKDLKSDEIIMIKFNLGNDDGNAFIDIVKINKNGKTDFADTLITFIIMINKDYEIEEMVTNDGIDFISLEILNEKAKEGRLVFTEKSIKDRDKHKEQQTKEYRLKDYNMFLTDKIKKMKVVISYSKKDLVRVHTFIRYLRPLVDMELIEEPWYCTLMNPGEVWEAQIKQKFEEADIVFFVVSEHFYSTSYIVDKEITTIINRYDKNQSVKVIPIILEHYDWGRKEPYNLMRFAALPYQAKPISDYKNEKIAWHTITSAIKSMIEKDLDPAKTDIISREFQEIYERQVGGKLDNNS